MSAWFPRLTAHSLAIVIAVLIYVLTTRIGEERRPPSIAISWVLGMIAVPYLALPIYLMFGRRKLQRRIVAGNGIRSHSPHWAEELIESFGLPPAAPSQVRMHADSAESSASLFETMASAESRLDICTYILGNDEFGHEAIDRMIDSVGRGVRVRLLLDGVGAIQLSRSFFKRLRAGGVETSTFSPLLARKTLTPRNLRDHRKLVVADGVRLWAGGRNLAAEYFIGRNGKPPWLDLSFDLHGLAAYSAAQQFETDWTLSGGAPAKMSTPTFGMSGGRTQFLPSGPDQTEDTVHALLIDACFRVEHRVLAVTPYFVPDISLETAMRLAARRGVRIDLVVPAKSNHRLADFARSRALRALSDAGVFVHLVPHMIHAKGVVFDSSLALSGSVNLDSRSLLLNYECAVVFYGSREIDWLAGWIQALIPDSQRFDCRAPGLWRDLCEGLLLTVAFQL
jgi:cardiolipin synthase